MLFVDDFPDLNVAQMRWFLIHMIPPLLLGFVVINILRQDPSRLVKTLPSIIPGLTEPKVMKIRKSQKSSWQLAFHADILNVFSTMRATNVLFDQMHRPTVATRTTEEGRNSAMNLVKFPTLFRGSDSEDLGEPRRDTALGEDLGELRRDTASSSSISRRLSLKSEGRKTRLAAGNGGVRKTVSFSRSPQQSAGDAYPEIAPAMEILKRTLSETPRERVIINFSHMWRLSIIPIFFCTFYFWDGAIVRKYVSRDYPLSHCHSEFACFYTKDFSFFFPIYHSLDCAKLRDLSVSTGEFKFTLPKGAEFYECYSLAASVRSIVGCASDCLSLTVLFVAVTAYFMVTKVSEADEEDNKSDLRTVLDMSTEQLAAEKIDADNPNSHHTYAMLDKRIRYYIQCEVLSLVALVLSIVFVLTSLGNSINTTGSFVVLPSATLYLFFLFDIKRETLQDYKSSFEMKDECDEKTPLYKSCICWPAPSKVSHREGGSSEWLLEQLNSPRSKDDNEESQPMITVEEARTSKAEETSESSTNNPRDTIHDANPRNTSYRLRTSL